MKQQVNVRVSDATREKLDSLTAIYGTQAEVVAVAVDRLWQAHQAEATVQGEMNQRQGVVYRPDNMEWYGRADVPYKPVRFKKRKASSPD